MKSTFSTALSLLSAGLLGITLSTSSVAHDRFILPSHTVLSSEKTETVSLISSISNDIFHPDMPLGDNGKGTPPPPMIPLFKRLQSSVVTPDGNSIAGPSWQSYSRFSAADQILESNGTYRIRLMQPDTPMVTFKDAEGKPNRIFGPNPQLPSGATEVVKRVIRSSVETFITKGEATTPTTDNSDQQLALGGETHPNDLFSNEPLQLQLFFNGQPLQKAVDVTLVRQNSRHRNQRQERKVTTDSKGNFEITLEDPGFYLLSVELTEKADNNDQLDFYHTSLYVTLEVFPQ